MAKLNVGTGDAMVIDPNTGKNINPNYKGGEEQSVNQASSVPTDQAVSQSKDVNSNQSNEVVEESFFQKNKIAIIAGVGVSVVIIGVLVYMKVKGGSATAQ